MTTLFDMVLPLAIAFGFLGLCVYGIVIASLALSQNSTSQSLTRAKFICGIGVSGFPISILINLSIAISGTGLSGPWSSLQFVFVTGVFMVVPLAACRRKRSGSSCYPPGIWQVLPLIRSWVPVSRLARLSEITRVVTHAGWFSPIDTKIGVVLAYSLIVIVPFAIQAVVATILIGSRDNNPDGASVVSAIISSGVAAPLWEETFFRWSGAYYGGPAGIILGSIVWGPLHIVQALAFHDDPLLEIMRFGPLWMLDVVFYIRLWRGRYYWVSYPAHAFTNIAIIAIGAMGAP